MQSVTHIEKFQFDTRREFTALLDNFIEIMGACLLCIALKESAAPKHLLPASVLVAIRVTS